LQQGFINRFLHRGNKMTVLYRVITDAPQCVIVGLDTFDPTINMSCDTDTWELKEDNGGNEVFLFDDGTAIIGDRDSVPGRFPEPDLVVIRTSDEWDRWCEENTSVFFDE